MARPRRRVAEFLRDLDRRVLPTLGNAVPWMLRGGGRRRYLTVAGSTLAVLLTIGLVYVVNRPTAAPAAGGAIVNIGVAQGDSVPQYVADRAAALRQLAAESPASAPRPMYALVSLTAYETPDQLVGTLDGLHVTTVFMRARPAGPDVPVVIAQAYRIPFDVESAMLARANHDRGEASDFRAQVDMITGSAAEETQLRALYEAQEAIAVASEHAWRSLCACVFAAVVYGTAADLVTVSGRPEVRAVDAVPALRLLDRAIFRPPLPEETDRAGAWPADRE